MCTLWIARKANQALPKSVYVHVSACVLKFPGQVWQKVKGLSFKVDHHQLRFKQVTITKKSVSKHTTNSNMLNAWRPRTTRQWSLMKIVQHYPDVHESETAHHVNLSLKLANILQSPTQSHFIWLKVCVHYTCWVTEASGKWLRLWINDMLSTHAFIFPKGQYLCCTKKCRREERSDRSNGEEDFRWINTSFVCKYLLTGM